MVGVPLKIPEIKPDDKNRIEILRYVGIKGKVTIYKIKKDLKFGESKIRDTLAFFKETGLIEFFPDMTLTKSKLEVALTSMGEKVLENLGEEIKKTESKDEIGRTPLINKRKGYRDEVDNKEFTVTEFDELFTIIYEAYYLAKVIPDFNDTIMSSLRELKDNYGLTTTSTLQVTMLKTLYSKIEQLQHIHELSDSEDFMKLFNKIKFIIGL